MTDKKIESPPFLVVCDEINNTQDIIDQQMLVVDVYFTAPSDPMIFNPPHIDDGKFKLFDEVQSLSRLTRREKTGLEMLMYVPGVYKCSKCDFSLVRTLVDAHSGNMAPNTESGEPCPNCGIPLQRVTWQDRAKEAQQLQEEYFEKYQGLKAFVDTVVLQVENIKTLLERIDRPLFRQDRYSELRLEAKRLKEELDRLEKI